MFRWQGLRTCIRWALLAAVLWSAPAFAQDTSLPPNAPPKDEALGLYNPIDQVSFWLALIFLIFGFVVLVMQLYALSRVRHLTADDVVKNCALTLVVIASVVLLIAGYNSQQLGPVFGLFGTMIGYVLGRTSLPHRDDGKNDPPPPAP